MLQITPTLASAVRIQKARTALLLDHPFFGTLLFRLGACARSSIATMACRSTSIRSLSKQRKLNCSWET